VISSETSVSQVKTSIETEKLLDSIQKKLGATSALAKRIAEVKERVSLLVVCEKYSLPESLLETDCESVQFLLKNRLLYTIIGFQNTSENGKSLEIRDGKIYMPVEGIQTPVHTIINRFSYDPAHLQLVEKETNLPWNYLLPEGLIKADRSGSDKLCPAIKLTEEERKELLKHAKKNKRPEFKKDEEPKDLKEVLKQFEELKKQVEKISQTSKASVQRIGIVRYNPFSNVGGDQSFSIALLDGNDNGVVITSLFSRDGNRVYGKSVKNGQSEYSLSGEEKKAIEKAKYD